MAKAFSQSFYDSKAWKECRKAYANSKFNLCERCGKPGKIVHHKVLLTLGNIDDARTTLAWENLELLCQDCHNAEHISRDTDVNFYFDANGYLIAPRGC